MDYHTLMENIRRNPDGRPMPKGDYFVKQFSIGGKIVEIYPVYGVTIQDRSRTRWDAALKKRVPRAGAEQVWRWRVRILTDEGWMLMGHIGKAKGKGELPPVVLGDRVELERLVLDHRTGGQWIRRSWAYSDDFKKEGNVDWRPNNLARQLHGKVKRKEV